MVTKWLLNESPKHAIEVLQTSHNSRKEIRSLQNLHMDLLLVTAIRLERRTLSRHVLAIWLWEGELV